MATLMVALLQMTAHGLDLDKNLAKGEPFCRQAAAMGADIALFPEMWSVGYARFGTPQIELFDLYRAPAQWELEGERVNPIDPEARRRWLDSAVRSDGPFVNHFRSLAQELGIAIAITYLERWDGPPRNTVSLIDRHGEIVLTYAKVHTCDFDLPEADCTPGDGFYVRSLDTRLGAIQVGAMICFDREFPESARILMLQGAELILTPNASPLDMHRLGQFRARAIENMVAVAMTNYAAPQENGHSVAFHPVAYGVGGCSRDTLVVEAGEREGVYPAHFDLAEIRDWREREGWGDAFRRPHRYEALVADDVRAPFIRVDAEHRPYPRALR